MLKKLRRLIAPPAAVEQRSIHLAGKPISYTLKRTRRRRSIGLRIDDNGLTVNMPVRASEKWLYSVLQEKADWVIKKLDRWQARPPAPTWQDGQPILFLGQSLMLRVIASLFATPPQLRGTQLFVHVTDNANQQVIEQAVKQWYQHEAITLFRARVAHYAPLMNVAPRTIKLSTARTQWGSCTASGSVRLNWQLIKLPVSLIDYVVVHELAHLIEMNHSTSFWKLVGGVCPDYLEQRRKLNLDSAIDRL